MSEREGLWGLRLLALSLAVLAWFVVSFEKFEPVSEKVLETTVRYDTPEDFVLLDRVERVRVAVRGTQSRLRNVTPFDVDVFVSLPAEEGLTQIPLDSDQVVLPEGLEVASIEPNVLPLRLDRRQSQLVDVRANLSGEPAAGALVLEARVVPNQVLVRGPASKIRDTEFLQTTPIDLAGHALSFEEEAAVLPPDPLVRIVGQRIVKVYVTMRIPNTGSDEGAAG